MTLFSRIKGRKGRVTGTAQHAADVISPRQNEPGTLAQNSLRGRGCSPDGRDQCSADLPGTFGGGPAVCPGRDRQRRRLAGNSIQWHRCRYRCRGLYRQLEVALQALEISGLTDTIHHSVVMPGDALRSQPAPARLLHVLREIPEAFPLTAASHEEDTGAALDTLLSRAGFTVTQAEELRAHRIRWPLMSEEAFALKND